MTRAALVALLCGCGSVPLPFEGRWTGTLVRVFECADGGGASADVATDWTVVRTGLALAISTEEVDCPSLTAAVDPGDDTLARLDVAHCSETFPERPDGGAIRDPIVNTRTWTDGHLRLRSGGRELLVDAWEHDEGTSAGVPYVCDGLSYGALEGGG